MDSALRDLSDLAGLHADFWDMEGRRVETTEATTRALLGAMGLPARTDAEAAETLADLRAQEAARALPHWIVLCPDAPHTLTLSHSVETASLVREDGQEEPLPGGAQLALPPLPLGIHRLILDGRETTLLCAPERLPLPERGWGVTLPLYGLKPASEGGFGTYADLAAAVDGLAQAGADFVGLNPVHAGFPTAPDAFSPYSPSHRRRFNIQHLSVEGETASPGAPLIAYPDAIAERRTALRDAFAAFEAQGESPDFARWVAQEGDSLQRFATYQALAERHGPYWYGWPAELCDRDAPAVTAFREDNPGEIRFHAWLQWQVETQLTQVTEIARKRGMRYGLYLDLAVGTHPHGAETWSEGPAFASGVSLGAPPDAFSPDGQVWALAPFNPRALADMHFRPFAETLRRQMRFAGLLRIDHILGFERAYWVPDGGALPGAYVSMPRDALLAIVRIEATRSGATVVGEDLGNIPAGLQTALTESGVLGCRVAMFEQHHHGHFRAPEDYTEAALASFGTHDLPTWKGWRAGRDIEVRHEIGILSEADTRNGLDWRSGEVAGFDALADTASGNADDMHHFLGRVNSRLVALQIEDILGLTEQANLPGTVDTHPNWRRRLPVPAAALGAHPAIARAARIMTETGRTPTGHQE